MENVLGSYDIKDSEQVDQRRLMLLRIARNLQWFMNEKGINSVELHEQLRKQHTCRYSSSFSVNFIFHC